MLFLAESRARHITDHAEVAYFQKTPNGFVVRYFSVTKSYGEDYRNPELRLFEIKRDFYEGEAVDSTNGVISKTAVKSDGRMDVFVIRGSMIRSIPKS